MMTTALEFLLIRDPRILAQAAKEGDGYLFIEPSSAPRLRHIESKQLKAWARKHDMEVDWNPRLKRWTVYGPLPPLASACRAQHPRSG
jgi:hypothetical protein